MGEQQRVEVLKMLFRGAKVLIMDEPTAVLTPQEVESLFHTVRDMTKRGHTIIFISHKLDEVVSIADRVTVLRRGKVTAAGVSAKGATKAQLAKLMVGREVLFKVEKKKSNPGEVVLSVNGLRADNDRGLPALRDVTCRYMREKYWVWQEWLEMVSASWLRCLLDCARCLAVPRHLIMPLLALRPTGTKSVNIWRISRKIGQQLAVCQI